MYNYFYKHIRRKAWQGGEYIHRTHSALEELQWIDPKDLEIIRLHKVQDFIRHAYQYVPYYKKKFKDNDIHPEDIKTFKDFQSIPYLTRDDVINHREELMATSYTGGYIEDTTGGSTGEPMRFIMDNHARWWSAAVETRYRGWYGVEPGDRRAWIWGAIKDFPDWSLKDRLKARVKRYRYLNANTMLEKYMLPFAEMCAKWQPAMFRAYPSAMCLFASFIKKNGLAPIQPKLIELSGEKLLPSQRALLQEVFGSAVADHYSSWEIYDIAYQCPEGGLHVSEDRYLELIKKDEPCNLGEAGEVVITSLTQYAMPFIRYKNGDSAVYDTQPCECGRSMPVLKEVVGRVLDLLCRPDGQFVSPGTIYYIMKDRHDVAQFQVHQPDISHLIVRLKCIHPVDKDWIDDMRKKIQYYFGSNMNVEIIIVDQFELTPTGKLRCIISDVEHDLW